MFIRESDREPSTHHLRSLLQRNQITIVPGVFNPISAVQAEKAGFEAIYLSGAAYSSSLGLPDLGLTTLTEVLSEAKAITRVSGIPLIVDADTGFGEALNVGRAVREFEDAGVAAIQIEDQVLPKKCGHLEGKTLIPAQEAAKKIRMAADARRRDLVIVARTDARGVTGLNDLIERAHLYVEAGADVIFPEALESEEEFRLVAGRVKASLMANMTEYGKTPMISSKRFEEMGYRLVIFPVTALRVALKAIKETLEALRREGTQRGFIERMMTREELYKLIDYEEYERKDKLVSDTVEKLARNRRSTERHSS